MARLLAALGGGSFVLVSLVIGVRLLWLWRRTRQLPELCLGLALLLMGGLAFPLASTARQALALDLSTRTSLIGVAMVCLVVGISSMAVFTWRVFRPGSALASVVALAIVAAAVGSALWQCVEPGLTVFALEGRGVWRWNAGLNVGAAGWAAAESFLYGSRLRRRVALGLAEPLLADRFALWGVAMGMATVLSATTVAFRLAGSDVVISLAGASIIAVGGLVAAGALWLGFLPPRWYRRTEAAER